MHQLLSEMREAERRNREVRCLPGETHERLLSDRRIKLYDDLLRLYVRSDAVLPDDGGTERVIRATIDSIAEQDGKISDHSFDHLLLPAMQEQRSDQRS